MSRWRASGTHLLICVVIAAAVVALMLALWYPRPLFEAAGGNDLLFILVGVDVVLGPLLTLIVFKSGKRGMKFDLAMIGLVQVAALLYGVHIVYLARPAFIVFVKDRFELAIAAELDPRELAAARYPQFREPPLGGPLLAVADMPSDAAERQRIVMAALAGLDLQHFPRYYVPYAERRQAVLAAALTPARMRAREPRVGEVIDAYLASAGVRESDVRALLLRTRFAWVAVLIDPKTAAPVKMLLAERIR
ncbi:MAG: TfpX/TfpZ family type IV pilin accessory protein [Pseudomonadota bacterium]